MRTWLETEEEIRDIIRNADELLRYAPDGLTSLRLSGSHTCLIRQHRDASPLSRAIFNAVEVLDASNALRFIDVIKTILEGVLENHDNTTMCLPKKAGVLLIRGLQMVNDNAIEVDAK